jgi:plasmid stability protein
MNVSINIPTEVETALRRRAAAAGTDLETLVNKLVTEGLAEECPLSERVASHDEFMSRLHKIIELHPVSNGSVDDSRESIYTGRGE